MKRQYNPQQDVTVKWAYSQVGKPVAEIHHLAPVSLQALHETFLEIRRELKGQNMSSYAYLAVKANGSREYLLGRFHVDSRNWVRWYEGWPWHNGLLKLTDRNPFQ